jgi:hypothetical protein
MQARDIPGPVKEMRIIVSMHINKQKIYNYIAL